MRVAVAQRGECRSFVLSGPEGIVVLDPMLRVEEYRRHETGSQRIVAVAETQLHAHHASTARALAAASWCALHMPQDKRAAFPYVPARDGARLPLGLVARAAPGRTANGVCYHVDDMLFLGDALEPPDAEASPSDARMRAATQHGTIARLLELPAETRVFPTHAAETTIAELRDAWVPRLADRETFVAAQLAKRPAVDAAAIAMLARNRAGLGAATGPVSLSERS